MKYGINAIRPLGVYIHIPFCMKKCDYCDFLSAPATEEVKKRYVEALIKEIAACKACYSDYEVQTIFFGGGTPSCLEAGEIQGIMDALRGAFRLKGTGLEATIEVNPGTVTEEKLRTYKQAGINRLSFGLQSADDGELEGLGRIHTYGQFEDNFLLARALGFSNINIDLMSALPGQTVKSWEATLRRVIGLEPEHISAYSLIIEEGTPFYERYGEGGAGYALLPDEDIEREIYHMTKRILEEHGYCRYEISNYARKGFECRHNSSYWTGTEYLGLGLGAASLVQGVRFSKTDSLQRYIIGDPAGLIGESCRLSVGQQMEEFMFLGLRMCDGISKAEFYRRFQKDIGEIYSETMLGLVRKGLLIEEGDRIRLSDFGIDVSNQVLAEFLLE